MSKAYIPAQLRRKILEQAHGCCEYCSQPELFSFSPHEIDHVIAEKHGGTTTADNLAFACKLCNTFKGVILHLLTQKPMKLRHFIIHDAIAGKNTFNSTARS